jgi:hypothetical protein
VALLAIFALALLLAACGGGGSEDSGGGSSESAKPEESTAKTTADAHAGRQRQVGEGQNDTGAKGRQEKRAVSADGNADTSGNRSEAKARGKRPGRDGEEATTEPTSKAGSHGSQPPGANRCPDGFSRQECERAAKSVKNPKGQVVEPNECPPAMSREACAAAGVMVEEAPPGQVVGENECPPVMSDAECAEAGRIYQEATK